MFDYVAGARDDHRTEDYGSNDRYVFSQDELRTIELCDGSPFTSGPTDSLGGEKPFFNVVTFRKNVVSLV